MTASSASPSSASPAPSSGGTEQVLRMRDPGELIAGLPYLMGFRPRESVVVVAFGGASGRRITLTMRIDLPPPEHRAEVCRALARNVLLARPAGVAVLVLAEREGAGAGGAPSGSVAPPHLELVREMVAALAQRRVDVHTRLWAPSTEAGVPWACYDTCDCRGVLPHPDTTPLAATAVAAGAVVHADRAELEQLVAAGPADALRRRAALLRAPAAGAGAAADAAAYDVGAPGQAVVDAALGDTAAGRLHLDDARVVALAQALCDPVVRDAALLRCAAPGSDGAEHLWAALARETPDPQAAEPAALLAACALLRGDGAMAGIALDRAERARPGHRLTRLLRAAWAAGMRPEQVRDCLRTPPVPPLPPARAMRRRRRRQRR
jgi:hypothetical protein